MTIGEIARAVGGKFNRENLNAETLEIEISEISTDSRNVKDGELFVALKGENFDGHKFVLQSLDKGAAACISEIDIKSDKPIIVVKNTSEALKDLAEYYMQKFNIPVVAVTGSVGKTTTKEMISSVLSQKYNVLKTEGNLNNEIGLPKMVFKLTPEHECAVLEMGMNHFGEIRALSKVARPSICVITNIGVAHIENLGSRAGILKAKTEIFEFMAEGGTAILNGEDDILKNFDRRPKNSIYFGFDDACELYVEGIRQHEDGVDAMVHCGDNCFEIEIPSPGNHMVLNSLAAIAVGFKLGLNVTQIQEGIKAFVPTKNRMNIFTTANGIKVIDDCYNANPDSMMAAINVLKQQSGLKACILGDMLELGQFSKEMHTKIGRYAAESGIPIIIGYGEKSKSYIQAAKELGVQEVYHFIDKEKMHRELPTILKKKPTVLVKGSRSMRLEETVEVLKEAQ